MKAYSWIVTVCTHYTVEMNPSIPFSVAITGGLGCVGVAITKAVYEKFPNAKIHVLDIAVPLDYRVPGSSEVLQNQKTVDVRFLEAVSQYHKVDVSDYDEVWSLFSLIKPRAVIHSAALLSTSIKRLGLHEKDMVRVNVEGTRNVVKAATETGVDAMVLTSSCDVIKRDSWAEVINVSERDDDLEERGGWDEIYSWTKVGNS
jgi:sterol-4alpha-carboxylate 3-dehydrogenase (decarboxylating)